MAELGKGYVQIVPSAQGISGAITKVLDPEAKSAGVSAGNNLGSELAGKLKTVLIGLGIGKVVGDAISKGMNFETATAKASTLFSGTAKEFQGLQKEIMGISNSTGVAASQLMEAAYSAESASVPMGNLGSMIEASSKLATAGFTDIDTALSATAKTMNAYGMMSDDVAKTQANMDAVQKVLIQTQNKGITTVGELGASLAQVTPTAAAAGVGFEQVGASLAVMTAQGTPTAQATTQLRSAIAELSKSGTQASTALSEAAQGTKYAGMSFTEMMASGADLSDVMGLLQKHADESGVSMLDLWSSVEGGNAAMSIAKDVGTFKDDLAAMATDADVVGEAYGRMSDTVAFKLDRFKNSLANVGIKAFSAVATPLANVLDGVFQVMDRLSPSVEKLGGAFMTLMGKFGGYIADLLGLENGMSGVDIAVAVLQPIIDGLATVFGFLADHIDIVVPALAGLTAGFAVFKAASGVMTLATTITGIVTAAGGIIPLLTALVGPIGIAAVVIGVLVAAGVALYKNWDTVKAKAAEIAAILAEKWDGIKQAVSNAIDAVKQTVTNVFNAIKSTVSTIWNAIKTTISTVWNAIKATITTVINGIKSTITTVWNAIKSTVTTVVNAIKTTITTVFNAIKTTITTIWDAIKAAITTAVNAVKTTVTTVFDAVKTTITTIWDAIKTVIKAAWDAIKSAVSTAINVVKTTITTVFTAVSTTVTTVWNGIKTAISTVWDAIKSAVSNAVNAVKTTVSNGFTAAKTTATNIFNAIKTAITSAMDGAKTAVTNVINGIKGTISSGLNAAKSTVSNIFNGIKSGISGAMDGAKNAVSNAISAIKSKFNFHWKLPHLSLPHISVSGSFSINPPSVPHFSISWHKDAYDNPLMFARPTVLHGFGDGHGAEMVYGHSNLMRDIREAIGDARGGDVTQNVTINSPQALNPSEVARQTRNQTRALLLKVRTA